MCEAETAAAAPSFSSFTTNFDCHHLRPSYSEPVFVYLADDEFSSFRQELQFSSQEVKKSRVVSTSEFFAAMSVQFLSQLFKPFATLTAQTDVSQPHQPSPSTDGGSGQENRDSGSTESRRDDRSGQMYDLLYNIDMSSGEGMCLSELYLCDKKK